MRQVPFFIIYNRDFLFPSHQAYPMLGVYGQATLENWVLAVFLPIEVLDAVPKKIGCELNKQHLFV